MKYLLVISLFCISGLSVADYDTGASDPGDRSVIFETVSIDEDVTSSDPNKERTNQDLSDEDDSEYQTGASSVD